MWSIWRSLLEETDKLAKAKLAAVEIFQTQIADDVKVVRQNKLQLAKKVSLRDTRRDVCPLSSLNYKKLTVR